MKAFLRIPIIALLMISLQGSSRSAGTRVEMFQPASEVVELQDTMSSAVEQPLIVCGKETFDGGARWYQVFPEEYVDAALKMPTTTLSGISPDAKWHEHGNTRSTTVLVADDYGNPIHPGIEDCPRIPGAVWILHIVQTVSP